MSELGTIARHARTPLVGQLAVLAFGVADTLVADAVRRRRWPAPSVRSAVYITSCGARAAPERLTRVKHELGKRGA